MGKGMAIWFLPLLLCALVLTACAKGLSTELAAISVPSPSISSSAAVAYTPTPDTSIADAVSALFTATYIAGATASQNAVQHSLPIEPTPEPLSIEAQQALYSYIAHSQQSPNYSIISAKPATNPSILVGLLGQAPAEGWCVVIDRPVSVIDTFFNEERTDVMRFRIVRTGLAWDVDHADGTGTDFDLAQKRWLQAGCDNWNNSSINIPSSVAIGSVPTSTYDPAASALMEQLVGSYGLQRISPGYLDFHIDLYSDGRVRVATVAVHDISAGYVEDSVEFGTYIVSPPDRITIAILGSNSSLPGAYEISLNGNSTQALSRLQRLGTGPSWYVSVWRQSG